MLLGIHLSFSRNTPKRLMRHFTRNSMDLFHRDNKRLFTKSEANRTCYSFELANQRVQKALFTWWYLLIVFIPFERKVVYLQT